MQVNSRKYAFRALLCVLMFTQWALFAAPLDEAAQQRRQRREQRAQRADGDTIVVVDELKRVIGDSAMLEEFFRIMIPEASHAFDSLFSANSVLYGDSTGSDSVTYGKSFLDEVISGKNTDSLIYDVKSGNVYIYNKGDVTYQDKNLKADFIKLNMDSKLIFAHGIMDDSTGKPTRPVFVDGGTEYTMDTIYYNIKSEKAKIRGVLTHEGEGIMRGGLVKKMPDNTINIAQGKYSTCDADHPHFYLAMTKAKALPGKKVVWGPSYMVMEDVPLYFLGLPFGFFPMKKDNSSGFIMPTFGEQATKGFFLRDGGYYFVPNDYIDVTLLGGIYTLGSWEGSAATRYRKRYKFNGSFSFNYSKEKYGVKGSPDYYDAPNYRIRWTHSQDAKFRPNSTFSASVDFQSSGYSKYSSNNLNDYVSAQTSSSISYSKNWAGKPYSFSTSFNHSQSTRDTTVSLGFPNFVFNVSKIFPFKRREAMGRERWYEKISLTYNTTFSNSVTVKERDLFKNDFFKKMKMGMNHTIPVSTSFNLFNYINVSPSLNYQERWYFNKINKEYNPETGRAEIADTTYGFYRVYNYSYSASMNTRIYGMYQFSPKSKLQAVRHVMTPTVGFSVTPDFGKSKFGYYKAVQADSTGRIDYYSPYEQGIYGVPGRGQSASLSFSLNNTIEMKVRNRDDSVKKMSLIDNLGISGSYNFLADSLNLSLLSVSFRSTIIKNFGINLTATFDPYQVDPKTGRRINSFLVEKGKLARLTSTSTSFGYNFSLGKGEPGAINTTNPTTYDPALDPYRDDPANPLTPSMRRQMMSSKYYDFSVPLNFGFNYSISYSNDGIKKNISQTLGFNFSTNLTPKWGITYSGGYDFNAKQLSPGSFVLTRDLHCWQMNFTWIPIGFQKSWSFNISVKSGMLRDLKYDKRSSFYDNFYDK